MILSSEVGFLQFSMKQHPRFIHPPQRCKIIVENNEFASRNGRHRASKTRPSESFARPFFLREATSIEIVGHLSTSQVRLRSSPWIVTIKNKQGFYNRGPNGSLKFVVSTDSFVPNSSVRQLRELPTSRNPAFSDSRRILLQMRK